VTAAPEPTPRSQTLRLLALEAALTEIVPHLRRRGIEAMLLKGAGTARWLYDTVADRRYGDIDLLVPSGSMEVAIAALAELGFESEWPTGRADGAGRHHEVLVRHGLPEVVVELHRTLDLVPARAAAVWQQLTADADSIELAGTAITVPSAPAALFIVAIHAAQHGVRSAKPLRDLDAAAARAAPEAWRGAAALAGELGAGPAFTAGLRLTAAGGEIADRLGLPAAPAVSREVALKARSAPETALGIELLVTTPGVAARARLLAGKAFPSPEWMRHWRPLARRGRLGLACAYLVRPLWLLAKLPRGARAWRRAARGDD
jgi:hypothetical protein